MSAACFPGLLPCRGGGNKGSAVIFATGSAYDYNNFTRVSICGGDAETDTENYSDIGDYGKEYIDSKVTNIDEFFNLFILNLQQLLQSIN